MVGPWCLGAKRAAGAGKHRILMHLTHRPTYISLMEQEKPQKKLIGRLSFTSVMRSLKFKSVSDLPGFDTPWPV